MGKFGLAVRGLGAATKTMQKAIGGVAKGAKGMLGGAAIAGGGAGIGALSSIGGMVASQLLQNNINSESGSQSALIKKKGISNDSQKDSPNAESFLGNIKIIDKIQLDETSIRPILVDPVTEEQQQLNEIIRRIAALEVKVTKQNGLLESLRKNVKDGVRLTERQYQKAERQKDEDLIESRNRIAEVGGRVGRKAQDVGEGIIDRLRPFLAPIAALGSAGALGLLANHFGAVADSDSDIQKIDFETVADTADQLDEIVVSSVSAGAGYAKARSLGIIKKASLGTPTGASLNIISKASNVSSRAHLYMKNLQTANRFVNKFANAAKGIQQQAMAIIRRMGSWFVKLANKFGKKIVKWFLIIEALGAMFRTTQLMVMGSITKTEWHNSNKKQINRILSLLGAPWAITIIFASAGTVVPFIGNAVGGVAGLVVGLLWGDEIYNFIGMDRMVDALYDFFIFGDTSGMKRIGEDIKNFVTKEFPKMIDRSVDWVINQTSLGIENVVTGKFFVDLAKDRASTDMEIQSKYGEVSDTELISQASEGAGTDENAILYAFRDVDTPEEYAAMKQEFETKVLPRWNEEARNSTFVHGPHDTMEEFLEKEMGGDYTHLKNQVETKIRATKLGSRGLLDPFEGISGEVTNTERFTKKYTDVSGVNLIEDVLGVGVFDLAGSKADVFAAFRDTTFPEYNRIAKKYQERNDSDLATDLSRFLGVEQSGQLINVIARNTLNKKRLMTATDNVPAPQSDTDSGPELAGSIVPDTMKKRQLISSTDGIAKSQIVGSLKSIPNILSVMLAPYQQKTAPIPAGTGAQSIPESATPSYSTRDPFLSDSSQS